MAICSEIQCPFVLALSHDVDRIRKRWQFPYYMLVALRHRDTKALALHWESLKARGRGNEPYWNFERIMEMEEQLGVRSTFFFLSESGKFRLNNPRSLVLFTGRYSLNESKVRNVILALDSGGWEIALHGSYHSFQDGLLLQREKRQLENVVGHEVFGVRQHYLNLAIPETWRIHASLGLRYDSTLGYSDRVGFRWNRCRPFYPRDPVTGGLLPVLEIPMGIMDEALMQQPEPWKTAVATIDRIQNEGGVLTLNWHQRVFNRWEYAAYWDMYVAIIRECQKRDALITHLGSLAERW